MTRLGELEDDRQPRVEREPSDAELSDAFDEWWEGESGVEMSVNGLERDFLDKAIHPCLEEEQTADMRVIAEQFKAYCRKRYKGQLDEALRRVRDSQ